MSLCLWTRLQVCGTYTDIKAITVAKAFLKEFCTMLITSYHPQCNGQTERCMGVILASLSKQLDEVHNMGSIPPIHTVCPQYYSMFEQHPIVIGVWEDSQNAIGLSAATDGGGAQISTAVCGGPCITFGIGQERCRTEPHGKQGEHGTQNERKSTRPDIPSGRHRVSAHSSINCRADQKLAKPWRGPYYLVQKLSDVHVRLRSTADNAFLTQRIHVDRLKHGVDRLDFEDTQDNMPLLFQ